MLIIIVTYTCCGVYNNIIIPVIAGDVVEMVTMLGETK